MAENRNYPKNVCKISLSILVLKRFHIVGTQQHSLHIQVNACRFNLFLSKTPKKNYISSLGAEKYNSLLGINSVRNLTVEINFCGPKSCEIWQATFVFNKVLSLKKCTYEFFQN